ncbi:MAG: IS1380 family transposase [Armatimonadota bacterium]
MGQSPGVCRRRKRPHEHCYLPLIVTARADDGPDELLATVLRPGKTHAGTGAVTVLKRIVARLREAWPQVRIILRGDSGFAKPELYEWCEREGIEYLIGLITNPRLYELAEPHLQAARREYRETGQKVRRLHENGYAAESWSRLRRVLIKAEVLDPGDNPRFVVTNMSGDPLELYDLYCMRGDQENRIKELKRDLAIDRTSCHRFAANQFRLLIHSAAFVLLSFMRRCLAGTELENAQVCTLQRKLLKLGVLIRETCRKVWMEFASSCPVQHLWPLLLDRMRA